LLAKISGQKLLQNVGLLFKDVEEVKPCLLHGDLWSGNVASDRDGNPVILDPACYCEYTSKPKTKA
jgi:fructosamine-3-kinase